MKKSWLASFSILLLGIAAPLAYALEVESFSILRKGGGRVEVLVTQNSQGQLLVRTLFCHHLRLLDEVSMETAFVPQGKLAQEAKAIFQNQALLATEQSLGNEESETGSWQFLKVDSYEVSAKGAHRHFSQEIPRPVVVIRGQLSSVLDQLETAARKAALPICH